MVKWTAAVIAGGGIAGVTQGVTATLRANSTIWTGGLGNFALSAAELGGALLVSFLALAAPAAAIALYQYADGVASLVRGELARAGADAALEAVTDHARAAADIAFGYGA